MQNQGPPYQGPVNHGSFPDHSYNNQMNAHCSPSGYQPYVNGPYNVNSPQGHHYGNHQMQPRPPTNHQLPYRGTYPPPPQNQYGPSSNQDMYRNHHSVYVAGTNRGMHGKAVWGDSNPEMMTSYNHAQSHPQMMNNSTPMNVSSMRSPPHLASVPSPGSQHYRQMQSPGHSPQSWPQVQVPSPGMHPVARTTPSPLQTHARSPGHNQPFSPSSTHMPPAAVNIPSHPIPSAVPENSQAAQMVNQGINNVMPTGPLHSLQKMVLLEQSADSMQMNCDMPSENNCDQLSVCSTNAVVPCVEQNSPEELKDSSYATYYNLDENRLESEPHSAASFKPLEYDPNTAVENVAPPVIINSGNDLSTDISEPSIAAVPPSHVSTFPVSEADGILVKEVMPASSITKSLPNGPKCPETSVNDPPGPVSSGNIGEKVDPNVRQSSEPESASKGLDQIAANLSSANVPEGSHIPTEETLPLKNDEDKETTLQSEKVERHSIESGRSPVRNDSEKSHAMDVSESTVPGGQVDRKENEDSTPDVGHPDREVRNPPQTSSVNEFEMVESRMQDPPIQIKSEDIHSGNETNGNDQCKAPAENSLHRSKSPVLAARTSKGSTCGIPAVEATFSNSMVTLGKSKISTSDIARNPVKVVIHRIRTNNTNETWRVPSSNGSTVAGNLDVLGEAVVAESCKGDAVPRASKIGPQIIILSPAMSKKKFGIASSESPKSVVAVKTETDDSNAVGENSGGVSVPSKSGPQKRKVVRKTAENASANQEHAGKKRGRPNAGNSKSKPSIAKKKRKGKQKNLKKKAMNLEETEVAPKPKKMKPFTGPYLRIVGTKQNPSSITVVNVAVKEEEKGKNLRTKPENTVKRPRVGHTSTLSPHYDAFNRDRTWLCAFCHKGSHCTGLGDLYGPYYIKDDGRKINRPEESVGSQSRGIRVKRRKSDGSISDLGKTSPRRTTKPTVRIVEPNEMPPVVLEPPQPEAASKTDDANTSKEVWLHEDCAVWCQSVSLMGSQILGLEEAILEAMQNLCGACKLSGATLGCWCKGCTEQYHFCCAKETGCKLDIENFSLFCPKHKDVRCMESQKTTTSTNP